MNRHLTTHDISWFIEADRNNQLNLDPPYQRRSVWTRKDRQFFLDTVFRNYPSPAIFLHKTIDENGRSTYHVVDGKQRIQTILDFVNGKVKIADDFGDVRLNSKRWPDLRGETELRNNFWNYKFVVEELDFLDAKVVNDVFDRINRNARKLTRQELRHAKYDGWFITQVETEAQHPDWRRLGLVTTAREKRMADTQFLSEVILVVLTGRLHGFDQDDLDQAYADYDDITASNSSVVEDAFFEGFGRTKRMMLDIEECSEAITKHCRTLNNFYSVWAVLALEPDLPAPDVLASRLVDFLSRVEQKSAEGEGEYAKAVLRYAENLKGANTDLGPRRARHEALVQVLRVGAE